MDTKYYLDITTLTEQSDIIKMSNLFNILHGILRSTPELEFFLDFPHNDYYKFDRIRVFSKTKSSLEYIKVHLDSKPDFKYSETYEVNFDNVVSYVSHSKMKSPDKNWSTERREAREKEFNVHRYNGTGFFFKINKNGKFEPHKIVSNFISYTPSTENVLVNTYGISNTKQKIYLPVV